MPRKWFEHDSTSAELEMGEFLYGLVRILKPELIVETGCYKGHTTLMLAKAAKMNDFGKVISCDINGEYVQEAQRKLWGLPAEVRCISSLRLPELKTADFVFSDSDYSIRSKELVLIKPGAVVVVHDTSLESRKYDPSADYLGNVVAKEYNGYVFNTLRGFGLFVKS